MAVIEDRVSYDTVVVVNSLSDLSNIDSSKTYFIDGFIDMGSTSITVPEGGISIYSDDLNNKGLYSTADNYTMFITPAGGYAGNVSMRQMTVYCTGTNSLVFNLDNDGNNSAAEFIDVNFGTFGATPTKFGEFADYRQYRWDGCAFIRYVEGFVFSGSSTGLVANDSIALIAQANSILFEKGTSLTFNGSIRSNINFLSVDATSVLFDFDTTNITQDSGLRLTNVRSGATDAVPNISGGNVKALFRFCEGIGDSYLGATFEVTTGATTTIASVNTPVKMAGTTTASNLSHFDDDGGTDNRLRYLSTVKRDFTVEAIGSFSGGNNDVMRMIIRHYDASASAFTTDIDQQSATLNGGPAGTRAENLSTRGVVTLDENDYIELWVENQTDSSNITTLANTQLTITER